MFTVFLIRGNRVLKVVLRNVDRERATHSVEHINWMNEFGTLRAVMMSAAVAAAVE